MAKINLSSIQNKANTIVQNTDINKVKTPVIPNNDKIQVQPGKVPSFNEMLTKVQNTELNPIPKPIKNKPTKEPKQDFTPKQIKEDTHDNETTKLTEQERNKLIALLNMYLAEFPEKLKQYKQKNLNKMGDSELQEMKKVFQREVSTSNSLNMAVEMSGKALELYEFLMTDYMGVNIKGISNLQKDEEYRNCMKALLLKYMSSSLVSQVEPKMKLAYLVISNSLICHQINSLQKLQHKTQHIESQHKPQQTPQIEPKQISEGDKIIKELEIRNINNKYSDL